MSVQSAKGSSRSYYQTRVGAGDDPPPYPDWARGLYVTHYPSSSNKVVSDRGFGGAESRPVARRFRTQPIAVSDETCHKMSNVTLPAWPHSRCVEAESRSNRSPLASASFLGSPGKGPDEAECVAVPIPPTPSPPPQLPTTALT